MSIDAAALGAWRLICESCQPGRDISADEFALFCPLFTGSAAA